MKHRDGAELLLLAAIWGGSFLFLRMGAGEFGPVALTGLRVIGAALLLLPLAALRGQAAARGMHWKPLLVLGVMNSALPFLAYSIAALGVTAGLAAIFNATTPLWGALIAWVWLGDRLAPSRLLGLAIGFLGVLGLAWSNASFAPGAGAISSGWAILACVAATLCYGWSANYARRRLGGVPPVLVAAGSQLAAAAVLLPPTVAFWPGAQPSGQAWLAALLLAVLCTGVAYILYFRLIARLGATNAVTVTFLIPGFAVAWGWLILREAVTLPMLAGCAVIFTGTALATGVLERQRLRAAPSSP